MTHLLTADMLRAENACEEQVILFESEWPNGMPLDNSVVPRIVELKLDADWFAKRFLRDAAWAEYYRVMYSACVEYHRRTQAATLDEYELVRAAEWAEYERTTASTAIRIYIEQEEK